MRKKIRQFCIQGTLQDEEAVRKASARHKRPKWSMPLGRSAFEVAMDQIPLMSGDERIALAKSLAKSLNADNVRLYTREELQEVVQTALRLQLEKYHIKLPFDDKTQIVTPLGFGRK